MVDVLVSPEQDDRSRRAEGDNVIRRRVRVAGDYAQVHLAEGFFEGLRLARFRGVKFGFERVLVLIAGMLRTLLRA